MANITINGLNIYYELHGNGHPLVLIPGYTCDHTVWNFMLPKLAQQFQVLIFDNRASGQTQDAGQAFTLETLAHDTVKLIQHLKLEKPHILGQSMGGAIAQMIAAEYPETLNRLIILNSVAKFGSRSMHAMGAFLKMRQAGIDIDLQIDVGMPWFVSNAFLDDPKNIVTFKKVILENPFPQSLQDQERQFNTLGSFNSFPWLHKIKAKTLVIISEEDICTLPTESVQLAEGIVNSEIKRIPGAHASPLEQYNAVNEAILTFLDGQ